MEHFLDFDLPQELIVTCPSIRRDGDRMIIYQNKRLVHENFTNIVKYFEACLEILSQKGSIHSELLLI